MNAPKTPTEIVFIGEPSPQGRFTAHAIGESIYTEADTLEGLRVNIREAVECHYGERPRPSVIRLRIVREEVLHLDG